MFKNPKSYLASLVTYYKHPAHLISYAALAIFVQVVFDLFEHGHAGPALLLICGFVLAEIARDVELVTTTHKVKS